MRKIKAGKRGQATRYVSRAKAIRKLQLSLKDFRRLCILKGVYPREPPKKLRKHNRTYYHLKDINFLSLDPLIARIRAQKIYIRKYNHAKVKGDIGKIKYLTKNKPKLSLNHLVRERYPDFIDALRDLEDPLSLMALFTIFPIHKEFNLSSEKIEACSQLLKYFQLFVIKNHCLKKAFVSIKGIYYQCEILNQKITYIVPHKYPPSLPIDVDYRVMSTFLDFYITLMKFVNYKLFVLEGLQYPPMMKSQDSEQNPQGYSYLNYKLQKNRELIGTDPNDEKYQIDQEFDNRNSLIANNSESLLFRNLHFYLSTEVPRQSLEYVILSMGGTVTYEYTQKNSAITHVITDRQNPNVVMAKTMQFVQPQWVYDSVNFDRLLNVQEYWYNVKELPPHISPFFDESKEERYIPEREKYLRNLQQPQDAAANKDKKQLLTKNQRSKYDIEYENAQIKQKKQQEQKQFKQISKNVISNTNKKLLKVIEHGKKAKKDARDKLKEKARKLKTQKQ